jgi:hypothetical protein
MNRLNTHWILNDRGVAISVGLQEWAKWAQDMDNRRIALTELHHCTVSTVFLSLDYQFNDGGEPLLFETMVFQGEGESMNLGKTIAFDKSDECIWGDCRRYSFKCDALIGHQEAVQAIEKQFGMVEDKVSGLIYGIMASEEWTRDK